MAGETVSPWHSFRPSQQRRVRVMAFSLQAFQYGCDRLRAIKNSETPASPVRRFYENALHQLCANYYVVRGESKLLRYLSEIGLKDQADRVKAILNRRFGSATFGKVFRLVRDKGLVHSDYEGLHLRHDLLALVPDALTPNLIMEYDQHSRDLLDETAAIANELFAKYPEALETMHVKWPKDSPGGEWQGATASEAAKKR